MLEKRSSRILLSVILMVALIAALAWLSVSYPQYGKVCSEAQNSSPENCPTHNITIYYVLKTFSFIEFYNGAFVALFTAFLFGSTFALWRSTQHLWKVTNDTLRHSEKTAERQLRAYVFIEGASFEQDPNGGWAIHLMMKNYGQTPAYGMTLLAEREFSAPKDDESIAFELSGDAERFSQITIGPQSPYILRLPCCEPPFQIPLGGSGWYAVAQSGMYAYLWGRISYRTFGEQQWLTFQMVNHFGSVASFGFCAGGNDSSDQCEN